jgi:hypothetical protein
MWELFNYTNESLEIKDGIVKITYTDYIMKLWVDAFAKKEDIEAALKNGKGIVVRKSETHNYQITL